MIKFFIFLTLLLKAFLINAQNKASKVSCNCEKASIVILPDIIHVIGEAPANAGNIKIKLEGLPFVFNNLHHAAWYRLKMQKCGILTFTIIPDNKTDDYDFILFKIEGENACDLIKKGLIKPIRSNISRTDSLFKGQTGLKENAKTDFTSKGINEVFSKSLNVQAGEEYLLILDNVYEKGKGFNLNMTLNRFSEIKLYTFDYDSHKPLLSNHHYCDKKNIELESHLNFIKSKWNFHTAAFKKLVNDYKNFDNIKVSRKGYFPDIYENIESICESELNCYLKKIIRDSTYIFENIFFNNDLSIDLEKSSLSIYLYKKYFFQQTPSVKIVIQDIVSANISSWEQKKIAAYNLKKILGFENRIMVEINPASLQSIGNFVKLKVSTP